MIRKFNFLAGVLLAMSAVVSCGSDDDAKVVDTAQLIKDANSAIDKVTEAEKKPLSTLLAITEGADLAKAKASAKDAVKKTAEEVAKATNVEEKAKAEVKRLEAVTVDAKHTNVTALKTALITAYKKIAEGHKKEEKKK